MTHVLIDLLIELLPYIYGVLYKKVKVRFAVQRTITRFAIALEDWELL